MPMIFMQTDGAGGCGNAVFCAGGSLGQLILNKVCNVGGTPGTVEVQCQPQASSINPCILFHFAPQCRVYPAGNWVVRLNVTRASTGIVWIATYVCSINLACASVGTIGSLTGQTTTLSPAGVYTHTVAGSAFTATYYGGTTYDSVYVVGVLSTGFSPAPRVGITPNQNIDTPVVALSQRRARVGAMHTPTLFGG